MWYSSARPSGDPVSVMALIVIGPYYLNPVSYISIFAECGVFVTMEECTDGITLLRAGRGTLDD